MTNFEYLLEKYDIDYIKRFIIRDMGVNKSNNEPCLCDELYCSDCLFEHGCGSYHKQLLWLNNQRTPQYKEGDIVLAYNDEILIVNRVYETGCELVNRLSEPNTKYRTNFQDIQRKVGSINE